VRTVECSASFQALRVQAQTYLTIFALTFVIVRLQKLSLFLGSLFCNEKS